MCDCDEEHPSEHPRDEAGLPVGIFEKLGYFASITVLLLIAAMIIGTFCAVIVLTFRWWLL